MAQKIPCPVCKKWIASDTLSCPNCGHPITQEERDRLIAISKKVGNGCITTLLLIVLVIAAIVFFTDDAQNSNKPASIVIQETLSPEVKQIVEATWPQIINIFPGLTTYSSDLRFERIEDNFSFAPEEAQRISIVFSISNSCKSIPAEYRAQGHNCFIDISRDGKIISIPKNPCKAVLLDRVIDGTVYDKTEPLKIDVKTGEILN